MKRRSYPGMCLVSTNLVHSNSPCSQILLTNQRLNRPSPTNTGTVCTGTICNPPTRTSTPTKTEISHSTPDQSIYNEALRHALHHDVIPEDPCQLSSRLAVISFDLTSLGEQKNQPYS
ncbi:hypothetical protein K503DRAFT_438556 [Rhizopogon vinicolor AM-OR11-026]|uniref:Uncharacterized protein n=1 Tax=Rhizopogon vinicolor AM-OR11-026 TaxID=1314800 RepID=A0A1B7MPJ4_9AGAM|nr:hypothetical protein K503DRAFT_438556 [Rhizopogon vinicolor AM-OR11-026]